MVNTLHKFNAILVDGTCQTPHMMIHLSSCSVQWCSGLWDASNILSLLFCFSYRANILPQRSTVANGIKSLWASTIIYILSSIWHACQWWIGDSKCLWMNVRVSVTEGVCQCLCLSVSPVASWPLSRVYPASGRKLLLMNTHDPHVNEWYVT